MSPIVTSLRTPAPEMFGASSTRQALNFGLEESDTNDVCQKVINDHTANPPKLDKRSISINPRRHNPIVTQQ